MEGISDIKIVGVDERKPPRVRKEPYIDIVFKLSHQVPPDWCDDFNNLMRKHKTIGELDKVTRVSIETWVRTMEEIPGHLEKLQETVEECSRNYIAKILQRQKDAAGDSEFLQEATGEQGRLNRLIAGLNFDKGGSTPS
ncbi:conserved hypothetical protein [Gammaproteobacteria bacterium]